MTRAELASGQRVASIRQVWHKPDARSTTIINHRQGGAGARILLSEARQDRPLEGL